MSTPKELLSEASPEIKRIISRVLELEKDNLHRKSFPKAKEGILKIIREEIKDDS